MHLTSATRILFELFVFQSIVYIARCSEAPFSSGVRRPRRKTIRSRPISQRRGPQFFFGLPVHRSRDTQNLVYPVLMLPIEIVRTDDNRRERRTFALKLVLLRVRSWRACLVPTYPARDVVTE